MVMGHATFPYTHFLYLFHMAVFFIASGYCWNEKHSYSIRNCKDYVVKKIKTLYVPYVVCNGVFLLFNNLFIEINILATDTSSFELVTDAYSQGTVTRLTAGEMLKEIVKILFFANGTQLGGATWFLRTLFFISVGHCIWMVCLHKLKRKYIAICMVVTFLFCCLAYELYRCGFFPIELKLLFQIVLGYVAYLLGIALKKIESWIKGKRDINGTQWVVLILISFAFLLFLYPFVNIEIDQAKVTNIGAYIVASLMGWVFLYSIAEILCDHKCVSDLLKYIGQNTLPILMLHFICFKLVTLIVCVIKSWPLEIVAFFPSVRINNWVWIFYVAAGVIIPLLCNEVYRKLKIIIIKRSGFG